MTARKKAAAPAPAPAPDGIALHEPGDETAANTSQASAEDVEFTEPAADDKDAQIAALQAENTQLKAMLEVLQDKLDAASDGAEMAAAPPEPRLIGENWSAMTAAEAKAAGCTKTVLCRDGYFVPGH